MDVVFIDKKTKVEEGKEQPKIVLRLDITKESQDKCTVMQIIGSTPKFRGESPWRDGSITSIGDIKRWYSTVSADYDAYVYDGIEHPLDEYKEDEETVPEAEVKEVSEEA